MKKIALVVAGFAALSATSITSASAYDGCGPYGHRGFYGHCHPGGQWGYGFRRWYHYGW